MLRVAKHSVNDGHFMDQKTDLELISGVKGRNCSDCLQELIDRHSAICVDVCNKYSHVFAISGVVTSDVVQQKEYLIYKTAMSYDPSKKSKFSTWLANQMRYLCLNTMNKNRLIPTEESQMNFIINSRDSQEESRQVSEERIVFLKNLIDQFKDDRIKEIFQIRYFNGKVKKTPWAKIAKKIGVSTQTAINLHNKTLVMLKTKLNTKNNYAMDKI
jgi:RNA polymerase sigma factor (sigma-70 family)|tara:strand:- start:5854 stop:6498 length:645 start_codon:yes stop_codon:yes gene_type:complete